MNTIPVTASISQPASARALAFARCGVPLPPGAARVPCLQVGDRLESSFDLRQGLDVQELALDEVAWLGWLAAAA